MASAHRIRWILLSGLILVGVLWLVSPRPDPAVPVPVSPPVEVLANAPDLEHAQAPDGERGGRDAARTSAQPDAGDARVGTSTIVVHCVDPSGSPAAGVPFRLRHIQKGQVNSWQRRVRDRSLGSIEGRAYDGRHLQHTDSDGVARWEGVPPGCYLFVSTDWVSTVSLDSPGEWPPSGGMGKPDPHEPDIAKSWIPYEYSQMLITEAGLTIHLNAFVIECASLTGRIPRLAPGRAKGSASEVRVELKHSYKTNHQGQAMTVVRPEATTTVDADGRFEIPCVRSGRKRITIDWMEGADDLFVISQFFDLGEGARKDLGDLQPHEYGILQIDTSLVDIEGKRVPPESIFGEQAVDSAGSPSAEVKFHFSSYIPGEPERFEMGLGLTRPLGVPLRVHGLYPAQYDVSAPRLEVARGVAADWQFRAFPAQCDFPETPILQLNFLIQTVVPLSVELNTEDLQADQTFQAWGALLSLKGDKQQPARFGNSGGPDGHEIHCDGQFLEGDYRLIGLAHMGATEGERRGFTIDESISVRRGMPGSLKVRLKPGAILNIEVKARNGTPESDGVVAALVTVDDPKVTWEHAFRLDASGKAVIHGLPPHAEVSFPGKDGGPVRLGPAGSTTIHEVRRIR